MTEETAQMLIKALNEVSGQLARFNNLHRDGLKLAPLDMATISELSLTLKTRL
jgi:hypothetical protein